MLEAGEQIDIWVVEKRLGSGGMGSVYRCHNSATSRILAAIKVLDSSLHGSSEAHQRFLREAEILFRLDHPNIVRVRNVRMDAQPPYLEMEFVEGMSLEHRISEGPTRLPAALAWMEQATNAVHYMHELGVRHRDIKPANLLLTRDGVIKLVDFGLAMETQLARITQEGLNFGTVSYAPPEWIDPTRLEPVQWDLYALGVLFCELLTGTHAFPMSGEGPMRKQLLQVMVGKQAAPPLDPGPRFADDVRELIADLTRLEPRDRPQRALDVAERLAAIRANEALHPWSEPGPGAITLPDPDLPPAVGLPRPGSGDTLVASPSKAETAPPLSPPSVDRIAATVPTVRIETGSSPTRVAVLGVLVGVALTALAAFASSTWWQAPDVVEVPEPVMVDPRPASPARHTARFVVTGQRDLPTVVRAGSEARAVVNGVAELPLEPGEHEVHWIVGRGCAAQCPGAGCDPWCGSGTLSVTTPEGEAAEVEPVVVPIDVQPGYGRVTVTLPRMEDEVDKDGPFRKKKPVWFVEIRVAGRLGTMKNHYQAVFPEVDPGRHVVVASVGGCDEADWGCWPDGDCPPKCRSAEGVIEVPWGGGGGSMRLSVPAPGSD